MEIKPTYVTFEQAKLLKEKGFDVDTEHHYNIDGEQYKPIFTSTDISAPEQWQVIEWLRVNHSIDLQAICNYGVLGRTYRMGIIFINKEKEVDTVFLRPMDTPFEFIEFNSPQEAYSAAFDYIKENKLV